MSTIMAQHPQWLNTLRTTVDATTKDGLKAISALRDATAKNGTAAINTLRNTASEIDLQKIGTQVAAHFQSEINPQLRANAPLISKAAGPTKLAATILPSVIKVMPRGAGVASKIAMPLAIASTGVTIVEGLVGDDPDRVATAIGGLGGSVGGGIVTGIVIGAVVGTAGPAILVTTAVGGIAGSFVGEQAAKQFLSDHIGTFMGLNQQENPDEQALSPERPDDASKASSAAPSQKL